MADDSRDLASRRGQPLGEYGALFPGGRLWHWLLGLAYAGLVALEAIGNDRWRVAATPYLDIALFAGLIPSLWRALRPRTEHERNADVRAVVASLKDAPVDPQLLADAGLADENGKLVDDAPPAWQDELTAERPKSGWGTVILRGFATVALSMAAWVGLLIGLAAVDWARDHWLVFALVVAALVGIGWLLTRSILADAAKARGPQRT